jgi:hypothetical protein
LMPVFGYLLVLNESVHQFLTIKYDSGGLSYYLPAMWRVWMLYYGSFLLAAGSILFAFFCPTEIKQYASAISFADTEHHHRTAHGTGALARELRGAYNRMSRWENSIFPLPRLRPDLPSLGVGKSPELASTDQWGLGLIHIWTINDLKWPMLRILILLFFSAGLTLLAIPAALTFIQVSVVLLKHLFD